MCLTRVEKLSNNYTIQLVICVVLVTTIVIGMGIYIARLNAWIDVKKSYLKIPNSFECGKKQGTLIIDSRGIRHSCYGVETFDAKERKSREAYSNESLDAYP